PPERHSYVECSRLRGRHHAHRPRLPRRHDEIRAHTPREHWHRWRVLPTIALHVSFARRFSEHTSIDDDFGAGGTRSHATILLSRGREHGKVRHRAGYATRVLDESTPGARQSLGAHPNGRRLQSRHVAERSAEVEVSLKTTGTFRSRSRWARSASATWS